MQIRAKLTQLLSIRESPHRIALAFSTGVFLGMSPLLGLHTALGIGAAYLFRLNKLVTLVGVYVTNPWTIIPIYTFGTWVGARCLGIRHILPDVDWAHISMKVFLTEFKHLLMPFVVGTTLTGTVSSVVAYIVIFWAVKRGRE